MSKARPLESIGTLQVIDGIPSTFADFLSPFNLEKGIVLPSGLITRSWTHVQLLVDQPIPETLQLTIADPGI